ncbi:hypothetical protein SELMODRAFT_420109 [Selaginella moellendorffii]|uniref:DUF2828 domain-containing protein n=1 Tax=Selaginella moellendorffii TaxID=88036 RepID=D8SB01_SELML|nr:uncharacterized protein LOC9648210 [Selaginella moellendorffii]EFJ18310.1 hypothetical protein SELMODRAFT_420109 [Selaginella moellendorffii]|eukprot:XP_002980659.1 uncharacterized protein LOC9648210 [Selaginella moellendorffii]
MALINEEVLTICGPPELALQGMAIDPLPLKGLTENLADTYLASGSACLDFFFHIVPDTTDSSRVKELATMAWKEDPLTTLKLIFQLRGIRGSGKSDKLHFYDAACWLYDHHPRTLAANIAKVAPVGYFKDLLELVQRILEGEVVTAQRMREKEEWKNKRRDRRWRSRIRRSGRDRCARITDRARIATQGDREERVAASIAKDKAEKQQASELRKERSLALARRAIDRLAKDPEFAAVYAGVARVFADALAKDLEAYKQHKNNARISLAAKWCPSLDSAYDKQTLLCEAIACKLFPKNSTSEFAELDQRQYAYRARDKLRKEVLVPLRKALELPEVYMSAQRWDELPYNRVASVAMKTYSKIFTKHDEERFKQYLEDVKSGKEKIAAGAVLPHEILRAAVTKDGAERDAAELQWRAMVDELRRKGTLENSVSVCDVSGSMTGTPMEVCIALGMITAELSDEPWKGRLITFSDEPAFHEIRGETLAEKYEFTTRMPWDMNTDFQKVFDRILERAREFNVPPEKMVKRLFVYSDMEFDEARGKHYGGVYNPRPDWWGGEQAPGWETDHMAIKRKFKEAGYEEPPQIVFWNLRDSESVPVLKDEPGVALVSGFSKNILKMFLENSGAIDPMLILRSAISDRIYEDMVVVD